MQLKHKERSLVLNKGNFYIYINLYIYIYFFSTQAHTVQGIFFFLDFHVFVSTPYLLLIVAKSLDGVDYRPNSFVPGNHRSELSEHSHGYSTFLYTS